MPKFNSHEEYLKWKEGKLRQSLNEPVSEKEQPQPLLKGNSSKINGREFPVKAFYVFLFVLFTSTILYLTFKPIDNPSPGGQKELSQTAMSDQKSDISDEIPYKPAQGTSDQGVNPSVETSPAKLSIPEIVKQSKKAIVGIKTPDGSGSGFLISSYGKIVTNRHVVGNNTTVNVVLFSGIEEQATVVMSGTPPLDIAILVIDGSRFDYDYLQMGESLDCEAGIDVIAIGSPLGLADTVTKGIISNCNRSVSGIPYLQTDTPINPGNSGGPLIDDKGMVIGVNTLKVNGDGSEGLGFAIAIHVVKDFMAGKLTLLEEEFRAKNEDKRRRAAREREDYKNNLVNYFKGIYQSELSAYESDVYRKLYPRYANEIGRSISRDDFSQKVKQIVAPKTYPPSGYSSWDVFFEEWANRVIAGEITAEKLAATIKTYIYY